MAVFSNFPPQQHAHFHSLYKAMSKEPSKKSSSLSPDRISVLEEMGFRWSIQESLWDVSWDRFAPFRTLPKSWQPERPNPRTFQVSGRRLYVYLYYDALTILFHSTALPSHNCAMRQTGTLSRANEVPGRAWVVQCTKQVEGKSFPWKVGECPTPVLPHQERRQAQLADSRKNRQARGARLRMDSSLVDPLGGPAGGTQGLQGKARPRPGSPEGQGAQGTRSLGGHSTPTGEDEERWKEVADH